jgi:hypothetical protein
VDSNTVIYRSLVRPFSPDDPNIRAEMLGGEESNLNLAPIIKSHHDSDHDSKHPTTTIGDSDENKENGEPPSVVFNPDDLVGRTFLLDPQEDGQQFRARIVKLIKDHEEKVEENPTKLKFLLSVNNDKAEEVITYNQLLEFLGKQDEDNNIVWKFRRIVSHQGPLKPEHNDYKGSNYNVMIEWETGEITSEPLNIIAADDPVTCAIYAKDHGLLDKPGWKRFKQIAKREKTFTRMVNQAKLRSFNTAPRYKYGFEVPRNYDHAMRLDQKNKNSLWKDAVATELQQINDYKTFIDKGHHTKTAPPAGYKKIHVHLVFDRIQEDKCPPRL